MSRKPNGSKRNARKPQTPATLVILQMQPFSIVLKLDRRPDPDRLVVSKLTKLPTGEWHENWSLSVGYALAGPGLFQLIRKMGDSPGFIPPKLTPVQMQRLIASECDSCVSVMTE